MPKLQHIIQNSHGSESGQLKECCNCEALLLYTANILTSLAYATSMPGMDLGAPHGQPGRAQVIKTLVKWLPPASGSYH